MLKSKCYINTSTDNTELKKKIMCYVNDQSFGKQSYTMLSLFLANTVHSVFSI